MNLDLNIGMLWVIFAENSPNSRPASPNFSTCSSTASTVIPNNYKRIMPGACGNSDPCSSDYIECGGGGSSAADCLNGGDSGDQAGGAHANYCPAGDSGAVMMVQAAVIIGPKDANIANYGTEEIHFQSTKIQQQLLQQQNITLSVWNENLIMSPNSATNY